MIKKEFLLFLFFISSLYSNDNFLTKQEYARMLYKNPRGIGCHKCHGLRGEGKVLVNYIHKNRNQTIKAPNLTNISKKKFFQAFLKRRRKSIMPQYFLTKEEIETLYFYLRYVNKKDNSK